MKSCAVAAGQPVSKSVPRTRSHPVPSPPTASWDAGLPTTSGLAVATVRGTSAGRAAAVGRSRPAYPQDTSAASALRSEARPETTWTSECRSKVLGSPSGRWEVRGQSESKQARRGRGPGPGHPVLRGRAADRRQSCRPRGRPTRPGPAGVKGRQTVCCPHSSEARGRRKKDGGAVPPPVTLRHAYEDFQSARPPRGRLAGVSAGHTADLAARVAATGRRDASTTDTPRSASLRPAPSSSVPATETAGSGFRFSCRSLRTKPERQG